MFPLHSNAENEGFVERSSMGPTGSVSGRRLQFEPAASPASASMLLLCMCVCVGVVCDGGRCACMHVCVMGEGAVCVCCVLCVTVRTSRCVHACVRVCAHICGAWSVRNRACMRAWGGGRTFAHA